MAGLEDALALFADELAEAASHCTCECGSAARITAAATRFNARLRHQVTQGVHRVCPAEMSALRIRVRDGNLTADGLSAGMTRVLRLLLGIVSEYPTPMDELMSGGKGTSQPRQYAMWLILNDPYLRVTNEGLASLFDKAVSTVFVSIRAGKTIDAERPGLAIRIREVAIRPAA